ncbi:MAG: hypothetical protein LBD91_00185, partial [Prevotellaceae bacterium]|nr:hypothetical protein [Prevotellaceae bacterium]
MNKHHSFRYRKLWPLFVAIGLTISFSNCNKTIENNDTIVNTVWKYETNDLVIELRFDDAETCSISNGSKNA